VTHYHDTLLERVRRDCVRLVIGNPALAWSPEERLLIRTWIQTLRAFS
jgi:hypothetical protein